MIVCLRFKEEFQLLKDGDYGMEFHVRSKANYNEKYAIRMIPLPTK